MAKIVDIKRVTKNTLLLYIRMLFLMGISLYTVRVILATLGLVDYGLFNVVGGIITLLAFMSSSLASSSQRFFSFELGKDDGDEFVRVLRTTKTIYGILALIVLVISQTVGLWFLRNHMVIPEDRMVAAFWVYQFSILSFLISITNTPYMSVIIANENMGIYAWISLMEAILKLAAVWILRVLPYDKLITYAVLVFSVTGLRTFGFKIYCIIKYKKASWRYSWDAGQLQKMLSFTAWNMFGSLASVARAQGVNVVLNMFFGPPINAARGVAFQINAAINRFASNFTTAVRPQIVKAYSAGQRKEMINLVFMSSRLTYLLMLFLSMTVLLETKHLLSWWLGETAPYMVIFTRLVVLQSLVLSLSYSLSAAAEATGRIKKFQLVVSGFQLINLPVVWLLFRFGMGPDSAFAVGLAIEIISLWLRLLILHRIAGIPFWEYCRKVLLVVSGVTIVSCLLPVFLFLTMEAGLVRFLAVAGSGIVTSLAAIWSLGLTAEERRRIVGVAQRWMKGRVAAKKRVEAEEFER